MIRPSGKEDLIPVAAYLKRSRRKRMAIVSMVVLLMVCMFTFAGLRIHRSTSRERWSGVISAVIGPTELRVEPDASSNEAAIDVQLLGVSVPDTWGDAAEDWLGRRVIGQHVTVVRVSSGFSDSERDSGALVYLADGQLLNRAMLDEGLAQREPFPDPAFLDQDFARVALHARSSSRGLWTGGNPAPTVSPRSADSPGALD